MKKILFILLVVIYILKTDNSYSQWNTDVRLTNDTATSYTSENNAWCVVSNGDFVHAAWFERRDGNFEIYYKRSSDGGITWSSDTRLTNATDVSDYPSIALSGSVVHVVWSDLRHGLPNYEIYYKRSTDGGVSWGADTRLTNQPAVSKNSSVSVIGQFVHVVWDEFRDSPNGEIYYKRSTDGGVSWGTDTRLTNNGAFSGLASAALFGQVVHVVWLDFRDANIEIYYKRSTDEGASWETDMRLTNNSASSSHSSISISGQVVHVVWNDNRDGNQEIYYKRSTDGGTSWDADTRLTNDAGESRSSSISVSGQVVHVTWHDNRDGNQEIYYTRSTDGGISWGADTRLTNATADSRYSSISVSGQVAHVVWQDQRNGNWEIYYKRNGNLVGITKINSEIPKNLELMQNYPNPFNPKTKIKFDIPSNRNGNVSNVKLIVFDIMGRELTELVNGILKTGVYEVEFDAASFPSGVYYYQFTADDFKAVKKMVLLK